MYVIKRDGTRAIFDPNKIINAINKAMIQVDGALYETDTAEDIAELIVDKIKAINPDYELLYHMRPGVFSNATLYNGYTYTMEKMLTRLDMDLEYLYNHSLWLYIKIIFLTVLSILTGKKF